MKNIRVVLEDHGQDFTHLDVSLDEKSGIGMIIGVPPWCSFGQIYLNKAFDLKDNKPGQNFNYADPSNGFIVSELLWKVEKIEDVEPSKT